MTELIEKTGCSILVPPQEVNRWSGVVLDSLDRFPPEVEVNPGDVLIIVDMFTNTYVSITDSGDFEILEELGKKLKTGQEYLVIRPKY